MAQDDMHVVMYKILAYLYAKMKRGETPDPSEWSHDALGVPYSYWAQVLDELIRRGFVTGAAPAHDSGGYKFQYLDCAAVTLEGVEFVQENKMMRKAARFLKEAKATIPFV